MAAVLTTGRWAKSRAQIERTTRERKRIRLLLTLLTALGLAALTWYGGEAPTLVSR